MYRTSSIKHFIYSIPLFIKGKPLHTLLKDYIHLNVSHIYSETRPDRVF